jgi:hypothetical protein
MGDACGVKKERGEAIMRLKEEYIHMNRQKEKKVTQITLDDDFIVPDSKPDISGLILDGGTIELEESRIMGERVQLKGQLKFDVLYHPSEGGAVQSMSGAIPFEEMVNMGELSERDLLTVLWDMEDLSAGVINSRKLNIKAIVTFTLAAEEIQDEEVAVEAEGDETFDTMTRTCEITQIAVRTRDTFRFREEVDLENNRPNIHQLLWKHLALRSWETRPMDGSLGIRGEFVLFAIYSGEEEHIPIQYVEKVLPFSGNIEIPDCTEEMIPDVAVRLVQQDMEEKPDFDGEMRAIGVEAVLELDIRLYEENHISVLEDVYCPEKEILLKRRKAGAEELLIKNVSRYKVSDKMAAGEDKKILQICHCDGSAKLDRVSATEEGLVLEGALCIQLLYLSADDSAPLQSLKGVVPFQYTAEVKGLTPETDCRVKCSVEQMSAVMLGGDEVEIKAVIAADLLALKPLAIEVIEELSEQPLDMEKIEAMPGMSGYVVQPGDTLWKIAKEFYTTVENIREVNGLSGNDVAPGDRLLVVKQAAKTIG